MAFGYNGTGQLDVPASLTGKDVVAVSSLDGHALALTSDGRVTGWGANDHGQADVPAPLATETVTAVATGCGHSSTACAMALQPIASLGHSAPARSLGAAQRAERQREVSERIDDQRSAVTP